MPKILALVLANCITISSLGQGIKLSQKMSADDLSVISGHYNLYFKTADVVSAIAEIDRVTKTDHAATANDIKSGKIKSIDLTSKVSGDKPFIELFRNNLGAYLILREKVAIAKGKDVISSIVPDESPEMKDLDGTSKVAIFFSEKGSEDPVFVGNLNIKLKATK